VNDSGAVFDIGKLDWMNGHYLRTMDAEKLAGCLYKYWDDYSPKEFDRIPSMDETKEIIILIQERIKTLKDAGKVV